MNLEQFIASLQQNMPPKEITSVLTALWYDRKGDWDQAHMIAQDIPTKEGSWVHAYLHRKEGDNWNANYWYNRADQKMPDGTLDEEWHQIVRKLLRGS